MSDLRDADEAKLDFECLEGAVSRLMERFDSVQVVVTKHNGEANDYGTTFMHHGGGNFYARVASVEKFLKKQRKNLHRK